ncbi:hypothetical protein ES703_100599 [subsurface metagenome]
MESLVEFVAILQKTQDKLCSVCFKRETCKIKKEGKEIRGKIIETRNIPKLTALVGTFVEHVSGEIFLDLLVASQKREKAKDRGHKIEVE